MVGMDWCRPGGGEEVKDGLENHEELWKNRLVLCNAVVLSSQMAYLVVEIYRDSTVMSSWSWIYNCALCSEGECVAFAKCPHLLRSGTSWDRWKARFCKIYGRIVKGLTWVRKSELNHAFPWELWRQVQRASWGCYTHLFHNTKLCTHSWKVIQILYLPESWPTDIFCLIGIFWRTGKFHLKIDCLVSLEKNQILKLAFKISHRLFAAPLIKRWTCMFPPVQKRRSKEKP